MNICDSLSSFVAILGANKTQPNTSRRFASLRHERNSSSKPQKLDFESDSRFAFSFLNNSDMDANQRVIFGGLVALTSSTKLPSSSLKPQQLPKNDKKNDQISKHFLRVFKKRVFF